jgi:hypothetical protein
MTAFTAELELVCLWRMESGHICQQCFLTCFKIRRQVEPREQTQTGTKWSSCTVVYIDGVILLGENITSIKRNTEALLGAARTLLIGKFF